MHIMSQPPQPLRLTTELVPPVGCEALHVHPAQTEKLRKALACFAGGFRKRRSLSRRFCFRAFLGRCLRAFLGRCSRLWADAAGLGVEFAMKNASLD